jgi:hypothetical protein
MLWDVICLVNSCAILLQKNGPMTHTLFVFCCLWHNVKSDFLIGHHYQAIGYFCLKNSRYMILG